MRTFESLTNALRTWRVAPPPTPDFRAAVWQRIEQSQRATDWWGFVRARVGVLSLAAVVTVGVSGWTGHAVASAQVQIDRAALAGTYVAGLDARVRAGLIE